MKIPFSIITAALLIPPAIVQAQDSTETRVERRARRHASVEEATSTDSEPLMIVVRQLEHADARDVSHILSSVVPRCPADVRCRGGSSSQTVVFEPVVRTNQLVVRGDIASVELVDELLETLDVPVEETSLVRAHWRLDTHTAFLLSRILPDLARICGPDEPHECAGSSPERIQLISLAIEPDSGTVVAYGNEDEIEELGELLESLE